MSKLYKNIAYNFFGQFYLTILSIVMAPFYVKYFGLESYGLIGFFSVIQSWMQLFDMGFTATLTRQSANYCNGSLSPFEYRSFFSSVQFLYSCLGLFLIILSFFLGYYFSEYWIKAESIPVFEIRKCAILIFIISVIRWQQGFYRGVINGFEYQDWLNKFNILFTTLKYIGVLSIIWFHGANICDFFYFQEIIVVIEFIVLFKYVSKIIPKTAEKIIFKWLFIKKNLSFSLSVAFTSSIWILVTQLDKLILSKYLMMQDYACFTLAVTVASGINMVITPIFVAISPRFSGLIAKNDIKGFVNIYANITRFLVILVTPIVMVMLFQGEKILLAWTNNLTIASHGNPILRLYALGNGILAVISMPYFLQFAHGKLRLHIIGNLLSISLQVPLLIYFTIKYSSIGAAYVWVFSNLFYLLFWIPIVHKIYLQYSHYDWLIKDIIQVCLFSIMLSLCLMRGLLVSSERMLVFVESASVVFFSVIVSTIIYFPEIRDYLFKKSVKFFSSELKS